MTTAEIGGKPQRQKEITSLLNIQFDVQNAIERRTECLIARFFIFVFAVFHQSPKLSNCVFISFQKVRNAVISLMKSLSFSSRAFSFHVSGPRGMDGVRNVIEAMLWSV